MIAGNKVKFHAFFMPLCQIINTNLIGMKRIFSLMVCLIITLMAIAQECDFKLANVYRHNGLLIFTDCEPVNEYDVVEHERSVLSWSGQYSEIKNKLTRRALRDYPSADGIIISMTEGHVDRAVVVKFKNPENDNSLARVYRTNGLLTFTDCDPACDFDITARSKSFFGISGEYTHVKNKLIRKLIKVNPNVDGVLLTFANGGVDRAVGISFKKR